MDRKAYDKYTNVVFLNFDDAKVELYKNLNFIKMERKENYKNLNFYRVLKISRTFLSVKQVGKNKKAQIASALRCVPSADQNMSAYNRPLALS